MMADKDRFSITNFPVVVDYNMSLEKMIEAGKYDWGNKGINQENYRFSGSGKVELVIKLVCLGQDSDREEVLKRLKFLGLRPGTLPELLALGARYPRLQLEFPIVQLGTVRHEVKRGGWRGLYLRRGNKERGLSAIWVDRGFLKWYRFIAV